jgi:hypothetical protein
MPGISDPNMASIVWERLMPFADGVIWCTPATQAWRQSEAAVWDDIDDEIRKKSILVITRADMLLTERDRDKVFKRVMSEAGALFSEVTMMSLTLARDARDDDALWAESGADEFVGKFMSTLERISAELPSEDPDANARTAVQSEAPSAPDKDLEQSVRYKVALRSNLAKERPDADAASVDPMSFMPKFS